MKMKKTFTLGRVMTGIGLTAATAAMFAMAPAIKNMANNMKSNGNNVTNDETFDNNSMH